MWTRSFVQKYRVSMCFVRCPAPNRSVKEFDVELSLCISSFIGIPDLGTWISGIVQLDLLSPLRKTPLLQRSMLSSSEASIQISKCGYRSEPPIPSCSSSKLGRQQSRCPRRLCDLVNMFLSSISQRYLGLSYQIPGAARFNGTMSNSRGSLNLWAKSFAVSARSNLSRAKYERLTVSVFVLHLDSLMMSGACLKSRSMSSYCPD